MTAEALLFKPTRRCASWTAAEDELIREHYPKGGAPACVPHMRDRTPNAISQRASTLGARKRYRVRGFDPDDSVELSEPVNYQIAATPVFDPLAAALDAFRQADARFSDAAQERARRFREYAKLCAVRNVDGNHQRRVS